MRQRQRCVGCNPSHLMDDRGRIKPDDHVEEALCPEAIRNVAVVLRSMSANERELLLQSDPPDHLLDAINAAEADLEMGPDGVVKDKEFAYKAAAYSLLGIILLLLAAWVGSLF